MTLPTQQLWLAHPTGPLNCERNHTVMMKTFTMHSRSSESSPVAIGTNIDLIGHFSCLYRNNQANQWKSWRWHCQFATAPERGHYHSSSGISFQGKLQRNSWGKHKAELTQSFQLVTCQGLHTGKETFLLLEPIMNFKKRTLKIPWSVLHASIDMSFFI